MKPKLVLGLTFLCTCLLVAMMIIRWQDPERAVYKAALDDLPFTDFAIASESTTCKAKPDQLAEFSSSLAANFIAANRPGAGYVDLKGLGAGFAVADSQQLASRAGWTSERWVAGEEKIPVMRLSRVGFSDDRSEALLCMRGRGGAFLQSMRKQDGVWKNVSRKWLELMPHY